MLRWGLWPHPYQSLLDYLCIELHWDSLNHDLCVKIITIITIDVHERDVVEFDSEVLVSFTNYDYNNKL